MPRILSIVARIAIVSLVVLTMAPARSTAAQSAGSYESIFGYTVTWSEEWSFDDSFSLQREGVVDLMTLWNSDSAFLMVTGYLGSADPAAILTPGKDDTVISSDLEGDVPQLVTEADGFRSIAEAYTINDGEITIVVSLTTTIPTYDATLAATPAGVQVNGSPVLASAPLADNEAATDLTLDPTAEPTAKVTRTQRGGSETPEATGEAGSTVTRTTRGSSETPTAEPQPTTRATGTGTTFTGPIYGYSFDYDPEIWRSQGEYSDEATDGLSLTSATSTLTIWAWNGYGNDHFACLEGEAAYYATEVDTISDWQEVLDADGNPIRGESEDVAWGVYSLQYENKSGDKQTLVDYISCQPIPGEDAVLIVLLSSAPENYNNNLDLTFNVLDTLRFGDAPVQAAATEAPATDTPTEAAQPTEQARTTGTSTDTRTEIDTSFDGSQYTSPLYGFTVYVPLEWNIVDETVDGAEEKLVLNNGTSTVTLWATNANVGDLSGCVDYAANNSGKDLSLLQNSTGGAFRGEYGEEAFGNFVYDDNGVQMMYFISCRPIGDTGAVLILIQDVEYSQFTYERRFRNEIEDSITMP